MKKYIIPLLLGLLPLTGYYGYENYGALTREKVTFDPAKAQVVQWEKPKSNDEWVEDVKQEGVDVRSTAKLREMSSAHKEKLQKVIEGKAEELTCQQCMEFKIRKNNPEWTDEEVHAYYLDELAKAHWEIEKLQQSVERIDKEIELRDKGVLLVPSEGDEVLLGSVDSKYVRNTIVD